MEGPPGGTLGTPPTLLVSFPAFPGKPQRRAVAADRAVVADRAAGIEASQSEPAFLAQYFYEATNRRYFLHFLLESIRKEQLGKNCLEFHEAIECNPQGLTPPAISCCFSGADPGIPCLDHRGGTVQAQGDLGPS